MSSYVSVSIPNWESEMNSDLKTCGDAWAIGLTRKGILSLTRSVNTSVCSTDSLDSLQQTLVNIPVKDRTTENLKNVLKRFKLDMSNNNNILKVTTKKAGSSAFAIGTVHGLIIH